MEADFVERREMVVKFTPKSALFTQESLWALSRDLDNHDAVSLLYLMSDRGTNLRIYEELSQVDIPRKAFYDLCRKYIDNWDRKIIEALVEIECFKPLLDVYRVNKIDAMFNVNGSDRVLNCNKLRIYKICEGLDARQKEIFLLCMGGLISTNMPIKKYEYLEMYFMHWESVGIIDPYTGKGFDYLTAALIKVGGDLVNIIFPEGYEQSESLTVDEYTLETYMIFNEKEVGLCVIVNQFDFIDPQNNRDASDLDRECLEKVMKSLNFKVAVLNNLKSFEFESSIKKTINSGFKKTHSILFLTIMSHGQEGLIMGTDGLYVSMKTVTKALYEANGLSRIPKVLVVCACRGDSVFTAHSRGYYEADGPPLGCEKIRSDIVDLIVFYSTIPGFISLRNKMKGSLFMQVLCEVLRARPELEICDIFTLVNKALMNPKDFRPYNPAKIAQPCEFNSRLLKKLYLIKRKTDS